MDSASGSMQSSSGGDEEYDSNHNINSSSLPSFINNNFNSIPISSSYFHPNQNQNQPTFFNPIPSSNFLNHPFSQSPTPNPNPSTGLRSSDPYSLPGSSNHSVLPGSKPDRTTGPIKNPKKRTRASRRAPTTVLTTDTSNFRAMVQEFTGIPSAPFSAASAYSRRLDLFSTAGAAMRSGQLDPFGSLLRPLAQRAQPYTTPSGPITDFGQNSNSGLAFLQQPPLLNNSLHGQAADFGLKSQQSGSVSSLDGLGGLNPVQSNINFGNQSQDQYKVNYSSAASSSDFHHHVLENVSNSRAQEKKRT